MSIYEVSITNPKKQLEFYKDLSEQLQRENKQLQNNWNELKAWLIDIQINGLLNDAWTIIQVRDKMQEIESRNNENKDN